MSTHPRTYAPFALVALASLAVACSGNAGRTVPGGAGADAAARRVVPMATPTVIVPGFSKIKHIVVIVQEGRTLNTLFAGFPGATTAMQGKDSKGHTVTLQPVSLADPIALQNDHSTYELAFDKGKLDGFDLNAPTLLGGATPPPADYPYAFVNRSEISQYWAMAQQYALADHFFQSNTGPAFESRLYLIAGQADNTAGDPPGYPWGCDSAPGSFVPQFRADGTVDPNGPFPCFNFSTIASLLDQNAVSWKFYAPGVTTTDRGRNWNTFDAIAPVRYGSDWTNDVSSPETNILSDISAGKLPAVSYVSPSFLNSDKPGAQSKAGPAWVSSVVDAIGGNATYWKSTAILITWSNWGGWFDEVKPHKLDVEGLGFRVPLILVSPYAKKAYVGKIPYQSASVLKFIETVFNLGSLGTTDVRSNDLGDLFDFSQSVPPFTPF